MTTSSFNPMNAMPRHGRLRQSVLRFCPFIAGAALVGTIALFAAAQQGGADKVGASREYAGPPRGTEPGADSTFKGPPPQGGGAQPAGAGYDNPGGMVDSAALQAAAAQGGIHYHVHYHGAPGQGAPGVTPGYASTSYVNPASVPAGGDASYYMPGYGPGNPGPMGSESGLDTNPAVGAQAHTGFTDYGAYGGYGGNFGAGGGFFPGALAMNAAYSNAGFVDGFYD